MQNLIRNYEYTYQDSDSSHHHAYLMSPLLELLSQNTSTNQKKLRILDLGCGNGSLSHLIAQQGHEVVGVEESESGVRFARHTFPTCRFVQGSIYNLPDVELKNSFDFVVSCEVIEHLLYPRELVRAAKKCLRTNGRLIVTTPYHGYLKNLALALTGKMDRHFTVLWDGGHIKFFSKKTLSTLLESEGFETVSFKFAGRYPYLWKSMLCLGSLANS